MSQQVNIMEFSGTQEDMIQPTEFLKNINRSFMSSGVTPTDEQKINVIGLWLKSESPAEEWFNDANTPKDKYTNLEQSFKQRFPNVERMKKSRLELERELADMRIKPEDLGITEKYRGEDVYTHVIFAEKIIDLAKRAKIETTTSLGLFTLWDNLPEVLQDKIPENQTSWTSFASTIKAVELGHIREGVRKYKERMAEAEKIQTQLNMLEQRTANNTALLNSPTKSICDQLSKTTISQNPSQSNPFASGGRQGNLFNSNQQVRRTMFNTQPPQRNHEEEVKAIKNSIALYPLQPMTEEGRAVYWEQMNTWHQRNGDIQPTRITGFPLCPGGALPGSGKCYKCRVTGHRGTACDSKNTIPKFKGNFRAICGSILIPCWPPLQVNLVTTEVDEFPWANGVSSDGQQQGNGEGPSAY